MNTPESPRPSYRQGQALKDALAALNRAPSRPTVTISRDSGGGYSWDIRVPADALQDAHDEAVKIAGELESLYPSAVPAPEQHKVTLTRNAKGDTQVSVEGRGDVAAEYDALTKAYPLNGAS